MPLSDIAMIAAETSRSRIYLQMLVCHGLLPNRVILLENLSDETLPGQLHYGVGKKDPESEESNTGPDFVWRGMEFDLDEPLRETLSQSNLPYETAPDHNINKKAVVKMIREKPEPVFIYSGYGGVLLRKDVLNTGKRFLHVHGGFLPDYKGSTTNYYSLLSENRIGASSIFLTENIDTGPVLQRKKFEPPANREEIDHGYDSIVRAKVLVDTLNSYLEAGRTWQFELEENEGGETYYIIHPVLKHIAILGK